MTAAIFPLDTSKPWVFNGVTYQYDASDDRWYVISTVATDQVVDSISDLRLDLTDTNKTINDELDVRDELIQDAAGRNNDQDSSIAALEQRVDALG